MAKVLHVLSDFDCIQFFKNLLMGKGNWVKIFEVRFAIKKVDDFANRR